MLLLFWKTTNSRSIKHSNVTTPSESISNRWQWKWLFGATLISFSNSLKEALAKEAPPTTPPFPIGKKEFQLPFKDTMLKYYEDRTNLNHAILNDRHIYDVVV
jgi:hypothetical protein